MELREALTQISEIRSRMAQAETFRGYRSATVGFSGVLALSAATMQFLWIPEPTKQIAAYLALWIGAAAIAVVTTAIELSLRCYRSASPLRNQLTWLAVEQFAPCLVAGALLTYALVSFAPETLWMLPGLWAILFGLGVFASCRLLPRQTIWVGAYYIASGVICLALARGDAALSPWAMVSPFGIGQLLTAGILYFTLERTGEPS